MAESRVQGRRATIDPGTTAEFLLSTPLFSGLDRQVIDRIVPHVITAEFPAGSVIQRAGSMDAQIGIVLDGRVVLRQVNPVTGQAIVIEELPIGDSFGEVGAMLQLAQPHEAFAEELSTVVLLPKEVVHQLAQKIPGFAHSVARRLAGKVVQQSVASMRGGGPSSPPPSRAGAPTLIPATEGIPFVRASSFEIDDKVLSAVPAKLITQFRVLPLQIHGRTITVGMVDPYNSGAVNELRRVISSADVQTVAISADDWAEAIVRLKIDPTARGVVRASEQVAPDTIQYDYVSDAERDATKAPVIGDEVVNLASRIISTAIERGASDIHIEQDPARIRIKFRVSGSLIEWDQFVAASFGKGLIARFKVLAGLDITERRLPQDGRIGLRVGRRDIDLRVSTLPASRGEKIVARVLEAASMQRPLETIFLDQRLLKAVRETINRPHGAVVVAGPTGSGKSSTLYASLNERKKTRPDTNIVMVEDPVEYRLGNATQVQVNPAVDLSFARVLRAFLRQDPDVIMVGEIRDRDTAMMALEAAMTGHLLFTSIHANDAIGVLQRFETLGCHRQVVAQSMGIVLVQRLARRVCQACVTTEIPPPVLQDSLVQRGLIDRAAQLPLPRGAGCAECQQSGYSGRIAVIESMQFPEDVRDFLMTTDNIAEFEKFAIERGAYVPFRRYASFLMSRNLLTPTEALLIVA